MEATLCPFCSPWLAGLLVTVTFLLQDSQEKQLHLTADVSRAPGLTWAAVSQASALEDRQAAGCLQSKQVLYLKACTALPVPGPEGEQLTSVQLSSGCPAGRAHGGQRSLEDREEGAVHELEAAPPGLPGAGCSGQSALEQ